MKRHQIAFDIDPETHKRIKIAAIKRNMSMNLWLICIIYRALQREETLRSFSEVGPSDLAK